ncbi:provirus ancestral Env polyprotein [Plecturocebus cupreus]
MGKYLYRLQVCFPYYSLSFCPLEGGTPIVNATQISNLLQALLLPKEVAVIHCRGHRAPQDAISRGNARADMVAKTLTSSRPAPAPVLFLTTATSPMYSPSERQDLILRGGTRSDQGWIFLNNKIALPQEQAPKIVAKIHQSLHIGPKALYCFVQPLFYSPGLQQIVNLRSQFPPIKCMATCRPRIGKLILLTCLLTKTLLHPNFCWIRAFPTSRETADTVASILTQEIIPRFGLPATIQSDNGPAFITQIVQLLHIPYHPQSSSKVEQAHGILKDHLAKLTIEVKLSWPTLVPLALARIRATPWEPTGLSPFELLYGRPFLVSHNFPLPTSAIYLFSTTYSGSTQTVLSLLFRGLETHARQHPCSQVTVFSSGSSNQDLCSTGNTPWYHVSRLKVVPQNDQWKSESLGPTCLHLTRGPCLPIPDASNSPPNNPSNESWGEGPTTKTQYIAQVDCRPTDCKSIKFEFSKSIANTLKRSQNNFGLCFLHDQTKIVCHKWSGIFGGCPYASCVMHKAPKSEMPVIDNQGKISLAIRDSWHARWEKGTAGKIYTKYTNSHPSGTWLIYQSYAHTVPIKIDQLNLLGNTILQNEATLTNQLKPPSSNSQPFSWLALVQQGVNMLSLTEAINFTNCFLCASLNKPPLAAVPLQTGFNLSQSPMGPDTTLTGIPLFKAYSQDLSLCYGTADNSSCNTTVKVRSTHYAPPGGYFWCNGTLTKVINASLPLPCVPVTLVPQLKVYGRAEFQSLLTPPPPPVHRNK